MGAVPRRRSAGATLSSQSNTLAGLYRDENIKRTGPHEGWHNIFPTGSSTLGATRAVFGTQWGNATTSLQGNQLGGAPGRFYKDQDSIVWLDGVIQRFAGGYEFPAFVLPIGYRPPYKQVFSQPNSDWNSYAALEIRPNGQVVLTGELRNRIAYDNFGYSGGNGDTENLPPSRMILSLNFYSFRASG